MTNSTRSFAGGLLALTVLGLPAQTAVADDLTDFLQTVRPYVGASYSYDSNLFRFADKDEAEALIGSRKLSDNILTVEAGFGGEVDISRQKLRFNGRWYNKDYDEYSGQDHNGGNLDLILDWQAGNRWEGEAGFLFDRELQDYANQTQGQGVTMPVPPFKNIRERQTVFAQAGYWINSTVIANVSARFVDIEFNRGVMGFDIDRERVVIGTGVDYISRTGNRLGLEAQFIEGEYDVQSQLDYDEYSFGPTANIEISEKTRIRGRLGYSDRDYKSPGQEDFDGFTGRLTMVRNPGEANNVEASIFREISTLNDNIANYAVIDGINIVPVYQLGGKTAIRGLLQYEERDFKGMTDRKDEVTTLEAWLDWQATPAITLSAGVSYADRSSNLVLEEYDYETFELRITGGF